MTDIILPAKPPREVDKREHRRRKFYEQTAAENNDRLNNKPENWASILEEIQFIEEALLSHWGTELD